MREDFHKWFCSAPHREKYGASSPAYIAASEAWQAATALQAERVRELEECLGHVMGAWEYDGISDEHGAIAMKAHELISTTAQETK